MIQRQTSGDITNLDNVERIQLSDNKFSAVDFNGNAGQACRLYQAALDRAPEPTGLKFHVSALDAGMSLHDDAASFIASAEFQKKSCANLPDSQFVDALYQNTLRRHPEAAGAAYWNDQLATHALDRASVLIGFPESAENPQQTDLQLQNGVLLDYSIA